MAAAVASRRPGRSHQGEGRRVQRSRGDRAVRQPGRTRPCPPDRNAEGDRRRQLRSGTVILMAHTIAEGFVAPGWEPVRAAFEKNFELGEEVGASAAVYHRGQRVVDIWGGDFIAGDERPYDDSTLQLMFSTTKGIVAIAVAMCAQRGLLDYDAKVANYWPEFAAHGKGDATVAQLLSHQCGLIAPDAAVTLADALDWKTITSMLADTKPDWPIGTAHGYHALTFGWLAGELIRRTDGR